MKIGDRVRVIETGKIGVIYKKGNVFDFKVRYPDGETEPFMEKSLELISEDYELLEIVSVKELKERGACEEELNRFAILAMKAGYGWGTPIKLQDVISFAEQCEGGIQWLIEKGFIEEKKPEFKYEIGGLYKNKKSGDVYLLSVVRQNNYALIDLKDANRWNDPKSSKEEAFNGGEFKFIKLEGYHIEVVED